MRLISKVALAGSATLALAGSAYAADKSLHRTQVAAPDRSVTQIAYSDGRQGEIAFVPVQEATAPMPVMIADPGFADMDRLFASMDAQMAAMMRATSTMPAMPMTAEGKPDLAALKSMPGGGAVSYSYYSSSTGANGCTQTVQMSSTGAGQQPKIVKTSSGDCGTEPADTNAANQKASTAKPAAEPAKAAPKDTI
jgi:hypothetical protein